MALNDMLPNCMQPCFRERQNSTESLWYNYSDFGECIPQQSDSESYPCLKPVYNGKVLNIQPELVHASLSGISIKHYYGKCYQEVKEEEEEEQGEYEEGPFMYEDQQQEDFYGFGLFDEADRRPIPGTPPRIRDSFSSSLESETLEAPESSLAEFDFETPICMQQKINFRNSFWNIHQPELCKLTWGQNYVSAATVTEHLHEHLTSHGRLCDGFHAKEERDYLLNKELDEYVRLKVLASPRELPPDEKPFQFKTDEKLMKLLKNPRCKRLGKPDIKIIVDNKDRILPLTDDDGVKVYRSKEEFCLTIGKHIRKPPILTSESVLKEDLITPQLSDAGEEEGGGGFFFNWWLFHGEESYGEPSDKSESEEEIQLIGDPCPPLMLDDFCRAAGKADFSDLRCNPDDF